MRQDEIWDVDAAQRYDTPGTGMFAPEVVGPTVDRLAELAGDGRALELAIGTGRVAVPLTERGVPVTGIELSGPMIDRLRTKAAEDTIPVVVGDMATARAPGEYTLVYLVFNTISNLLTQAEQVACFGTRRVTSRPVAASSSSCGSLSCAGSRPASRPQSAGRSRATSWWTPTTSCTNTSSRIISTSTAGSRRSSSGARTATSGRPSST